MLFSSLILLIVGLVVFFHYIQGFFSSTISAILAVFSAVVAFSYHENVAALFGSHAADFAAPLSLLVMFALIYVILRAAFDGAIKGNIRMPFALDKAGSVVMGLIAGIFGAGIVAIAAQELPFNPDIAGFTRFDVQPTRTVTVSMHGRASTSASWDELNSSTPGSMGDPHGIAIIPVDDIVVNFVNKLSADTGSLSNGHPLSDTHPDFLTEAFGQRLGIEGGAAKVAVNSPSAHVESVKLVGLFTVDPKVAESEFELNPRYGGALKDVRPNGGEMFLVAHLALLAPAAEADNMVRFSPGSVRLMAHDPSAVADEQNTDYYPVGTMFGTDKLLLSKPDDFMFATPGKDVDFVYKVPKKLFEKQGSDGSFIEFKRAAHIDLAGQKVAPSVTADDENTGLIRKLYIEHPDQNPDLQNQPAPPNIPSSGAPKASTPAASGSTPSAAGNDYGTPFNIAKIDKTVRLPVAFGVAASSDPAALIQLPDNGNIKLVDGKLKTVVVDTAIAQLVGPQKVTEFSIPPGTAMIQITGTPPANAPWNFTTEPEQYELIDNQQKLYQPYGVVAAYKGTAGSMLMMRYIDQTNITVADAPKSSSGPTMVTLIFNVPDSVTILNFVDHGTKSKALNLPAK